jgi:hypothetical protein
MKQGGDRIEPDETDLAGQNLGLEYMELSMTF